MTQCPDVPSDCTPTHSAGAPVPTTLKPRRRWWRFFFQFSLRTLLVVTTLAAVGCWWYLQPPTREEELAGKHLKLRRQVKLIPRHEGAVAQYARLHQDVELPGRRHPAARPSSAAVGRRQD